jgi:hypothetical protein
MASADPSGPGNGHPDDVAALFLEHGMSIRDMARGRGSAADGCLPP